MSKTFSVNEILYTYLYTLAQMKQETSDVIINNLERPSVQSNLKSQMPEDTHTNVLAAVL